MNLSRNHTVSLYTKELWLTGMAVLALVGVTVGALSLQRESEKVDLDAVSPALMQKWHDGLHGGLSGAEGARAYLNAIKQRKAMSFFRKGLAAGDPPPSWQAMGPSPIVDGQTNTTPAPVSGRVVTIQGILKSTDGGNSWTLLGNNLFAGVKMRKIVVEPLDSNHLYLGCEKGFYESHDAGVTWTLSSVAGMSGTSGGFPIRGEVVL